MTNRIAVIYTHFPHYRTAVFAALSASQNLTFDFYYDLGGISSTIESGAFVDNHYAMPVRQWRGLMWQWQAVTHVLTKPADGYIFLGNPHILSTWVASALARIRRKPVFFWTHGWLRRDSWAKRLTKGAFFRLASGLLVYGERARDLGVLEGYPRERIHVVFNSLDYDAQRQAREAVLREEDANSSESPDLGKKPYFLAVSRLIPEVGLDQAIEALARVSEPAALIVVGAGPERDRLERLAIDFGVDVRFVGAIYDESTLAKLFLNTKAVVSPGKVGLLAMHALAYGATVITHDNLDRQMPEVEALEPEVTGAFFRYGDKDDLARKMTWALGRTEEDRLRCRAAGIARLEDNYTPEAQVAFITAAMYSVFRRSV